MKQEKCGSRQRQKKLAHRDIGDPGGLEVAPLKLLRCKKVIALRSVRDKRESIAKQNTNTSHRLPSASLLA